MAEYVPAAFLSPSLCSFGIHRNGGDAMLSYSPEKRKAGPRCPLCSSCGILSL